MAHATSAKVEFLGLCDRRRGSKNPYGFFLIQVHATIGGKRELNEALAGLFMKRYRNRRRRYVRDNPTIPTLIIEPGRYNVGWHRRRIGDSFVEEHFFDRIS